MATKFMDIQEPQDVTPDDPYQLIGKLYAISQKDYEAMRAMQAKYANLDRMHGRQIETIEAMQVVESRLRECLDKYGEHLSQCPSRDNMNAETPCLCGLREAVAATQREVES